MINKLLLMHNIQYIISVDDCFFAYKREEMEATLYSELCDDLTPFEAILKTSNQAESIEEIKDLVDLGEDPNSLVHSLVENLDVEHLQACYEICKKEGELFVQERTGITSFLEKLKDEGTIKGYWTFASTTEANDFDVRQAGINEGAILWLLDRNFMRVEESADAGLVLAENLVKRTSDVQNYIYILSAVDVDSEESEDDVEAKFDEVLSSKCSAQTHSFIYYINKQRVLTNNTNRIAKSLAQGFKRKACFELFQIYTDCLSDSLSEANTQIQKIRQKSLGFLFGSKVSKNGESYTGFVARLVQIFYNDEFNKAIAGKFEQIAIKKKYYEDLCEVVADSVGNEKELTKAVMPYRKKELYNTHINAQHCEIATGDIFEIGGATYILVSQSCDTYLRADGSRELKQATLLEIVDDTIPRKYAYKLSCYDEMRKPAVVFRNKLQIPFEVLDLCVYNKSGQAMADVSDMTKHEKALSLYTKNYQLRFTVVVNELAKLHHQRCIIKSFYENPGSVSMDTIKEAVSVVQNTDPVLMNYEAVDDVLVFPVKRVCRINELTAIDIIKEYGTMLSRIGHPFDFIDDNRCAE